MKRQPIFTEVLLLNTAMVALAIAAAALTTGFDRDRTGLLAGVTIFTLALTCLLNIVILRRRFTPLEDVITEMEKVDLSRPGANLPDWIDGVADTEEAERLESAFLRMMRRLEAERHRSSSAALAAQEQATEALARVFGADHGTFFFTDDRSAESGASMVTLNAEGIVLEASRRADELATLRRVLPPLAAMVQVDHVQLPVSGRLPEHDQRIIRLVVGHPLSIDELIRQFGDDELLAVRTIVSLRERGILALKDQPRTTRRTEPVAPVGVMPRTLQHIRDLIQGGQLNDESNWAPSITEVRQSAPAGSHTTALLTRTARDVVAAFNAGLALLAFAHFSDEYFRRIGEISDEEAAVLEMGHAPLNEQEQQTFVGLKDARTLADGRVSAIVVTRLPNSPESKKVVIFRVNGDLCQIDSIIESALERERHTQTMLLSATGMLVQDSHVLRRHL